MNFNFFILNSNDTLWSTIVNKCKVFDFYHTLSYNKLEKSGNTLLFVLEFDNNCLALPLVIRAIPNSHYLDATSVYGYAGPISSIPFEEINHNIFHNFQQNLLNYFKENKIVSVFSRLHPLIDNNDFFLNFGTIENINKTVYVDLRLTLEEQKKQYRKSNKSELNQLRRKNYVVEEAKTKDEIDEFVSIYHETMKRVDASANYFFDYDYFYSFLNSTCFENKLLLAKIDNDIAAGAIFTVTNKVMQYHLAGTKESFIKETPMKLILDEARLKANELHLDYLHLGGGVGGSDEDTLFRFKSGFSNKTGDFKVWKMIVNHDVYNQLVKDKDIKDESTFFPLYRLHN